MPGGPVRPVATSKRKRSDSPSAIARKLISLVRAAASSMAKGMPSSCSQIWTTKAAEASSTRSPGDALAARSMNSFPASDLVTRSTPPTWPPSGS